MASPRKLGRPIVGHARLRLRRRISPLAWLLPTMRWISTSGLIIALLAGGYRFLTTPQSVGALDFTPHLLNTEGDAIGVLGIAVSDTDGDGDQDIVTAGRDGVKVYIQQEDKTFERKIIEENIGAERVQLVDLNADNTVDILVALRDSPGVRWYANNGNNEFSGFSVGSGSQGKAYGGDMNGDGHGDIVTAHTEGEDIVLRQWINNGDGTFNSTTLSSDSAVSAVTLGDVDDNGYRDIITGGEQGLQRWNSTDGLTWNRIDIDETNKNRTHLVTADVTGDGKLDIVTGDQTSNVVALYRQKTNVQFERIQFAGDADALTVQAIDIDEDGDEDVITAAQDDNSIFWFENDGSETFTKQTLASDLQTVFAMVVTDIDNDNDFDLVTSDHFRGRVWWFERTRAKPTAATPSSITQSTDGSGRISFDTTLSNPERDPTSVRIQYSLDGDHWYKPWLISVNPDKGSVNLRNEHAYQVGTTNPIDTDEHSSVKLTLVWDTKSVRNTGGALTSTHKTVQLRVIPNDAVGNGAVAVTGKFKVDNIAPKELRNLRIVSINETEATLAWDPGSDESSFQYELYYGTDHAAVLEQRSEVWNVEDDETMADATTSTATITGLAANQNHTFKLFAVDDFGNRSAAPSVRGVTNAPAPVVSVAPPTPGISIVPTTPPPVPSPVFSPAPGISPAASPVITPSPTIDLFPSTPPTSFQNTPPVADAGPDQSVSPTALVVLDGTASFDSDGDRLNFTWRQLDGPRVDLLSERTAQPSFQAGGDNQTYIFAVTVRDPDGAQATDTVTIATQIPISAEVTPVIVEPADPAVVVDDEQPSLFLAILRPIDLFFFGLALLSTIISLAERLGHSLRDRSGGAPAPTPVASTETPKGKVVHFRTGEPIAGAQVLIYGGDGKLRSRDRTNAKGEFATLFPAGEYSIGIEAPGFAFAPAAGNILKPEQGIVYAGGRITVRDSNKPLSIVVPMKPTGQEVSSSRTRALHFWQTVQHLGRITSWPIFIVGSLLNTALIFLVPSGLYLFIELLYVVLVVIKVAMEVRVRPAYGLVRDAITHVPLDLAVVRLYEQGSNRLIMTRVTNSQGKFFALPPSGTYTITVTKPGYAVFSKDKVSITSEQDSVLQITADLMPVAPVGGLAQVRAAVL